MAKINENRERQEVLGESGTPPAVDGIANPSSGGDTARLGQQQKRASQVALDAQRAKINNTEVGRPFFEQLTNLVGSTDAALVDQVVLEDALLDEFVASHKARNGGKEPSAEEWFRFRDEARRQRAQADRPLGAPGEPTSKNVTNTRYQHVSYIDKINKKSPAEKPEDSVQLVGSRLVRYGEDASDDAREESDAPVFLIDALIWIQGVEISEYVIGTVSVSLNGTQGVNTATFTLENSDNRFVWTERNLYEIHGTSARLAGAPYTKELDRAIAARGDIAPELLPFEVAEQLRRIRFTQHEKAKEAIYNYKANPRRNPPIRNPRNTLTHARFDMAPNRCIFNRMDPVRIFSLYPWRVPGKVYETSLFSTAEGDITDDREKIISTRAELWIPEFTGYVENCSIDDDDLTGASQITIECSDFRQSVLRRMRLSADLTSGLANPLDALGFRLSPTGQVLGRGAQLTQDKEFQERFQDNTEGWYNIDNTTFYDDVIVTEYNQPFPNKSLEEAIREVLVPKGAITAERNNRGVRGVEFGGNFYYDSLSFTQTQAQTFLEGWHKFCLFGPKRRPWTREEVDIVGAGTTTDGGFAPNNVRLWFLLPISGSGPRNLADLSQISMSMNHDVNWTNRQEIITNFAESLDYNFMVTPTGDLICEFQMADFRPEDFGEFKNSFRVDKHLISTQIGDEQSSPPAGLIVTTNFAQGHTSTGEQVADAQLTKSFAYSPYIAARYGIEIENDSIPFLLATDKKVAQQRAVILYQRLLARSNAMSFSFTYRPFLLPNRPMHHLRRTRIGSVVTLDKTITLGVQPKGECSVGLEHVRLFTGHYRSEKDKASLNPDQVKDNESKGATEVSIDSVQPGSDPIELQVYTTVAAGESTPTSARTGWSNSSVLAPASGVYVLDLDTTKKVERDIVTAPADPDTAEEVGTTEPAPTEEPPKESDLYKFPNNPLASMVLSAGASGFQESRSDGSKHQGIDLVATQRTKLFAVADGKLLGLARQGKKPGAKGGSKEGHVLVLETDTGFAVWHMHLHPDTVTDFNWANGAKVTAGQQIGWTGNTGGVRPQPTAANPDAGQHLHLEVVPYKQARNQGKVHSPVINQRVDPTKYLPAFSDKEVG